MIIGSDNSKRHDADSNAVSSLKQSIAASSDKGSWLQDLRLQTVLRSAKTIAFEYDLKTNEQYVTEYIGSYIAGNYDGRMLSQVMLDDGVIHPDDLALSLAFRDKIKSHQPGEMTLRLMTPTGTYRWFKMSLSPFNDGRSEGCFVGVLSDIDEEMRQRKILLYRAEYDSVSGIYNKTTFFERTQKMLDSNPKKLYYLLRFDIDRFKIINELYSISQGDKVLKYVGDTIRSMARPGETYARMENDVFCMCVSRTKEEVLQLIDRLGHSINEYPLDFQFVLSTGVVLISEYKGQSLSLLCDYAAMAQRTVKGNFVHRYAFYNESMSRALAHEHFITSNMRYALENGQFIVYLQPKYDMRTNKIIGAEVLARWNHPAKGMISPGEFIPLFEKNGFILSLDEYIWEQACKILRSWKDRGIKPVPLSVNVSRLHLHGPEFCDKIISLTKKYGIENNLIEMEITESAYADCSQNLYSVMEYLQSCGFVFSMDDFGSGYSSLSILKDIPINIVKIDLNFLKESRRGKDAGNGILKGAVSLVQSMGLPIIAEGVETREQSEFLLSIGCTQAQGYLYAKPMPLDDFENLLAKS